MPSHNGTQNPLTTIQTLSYEPTIQRLETKLTDTGMSKSKTFSPVALIILPSGDILIEIPHKNSI